MQTVLTSLPVTLATQHQHSSSHCTLHEVHIYQQMLTTLAVLRLELQKWYYIWDYKQQHIKFYLIFFSQLTNSTCTPSHTKTCFSNSSHISFNLISHHQTNIMKYKYIKLCQYKGPCINFSEWDLNSLYCLPDWFYNTMRCLT